MYVFGLLLCSFYVSPLNLQGLAEGRAERSEERQLSAFGINASASFVEVVLIQFKADVVPLFLDARDGGRSAAHAVVENRVAFVGIGADEVSQQVHRLLGGVEGVGIGSKSLDAQRVSLSVIVRRWAIVCSR